MTPPTTERPGTSEEAARLYDLTTAFVTSRAVWAFAKLGLADHIAAGVADADALARATATNPDALRRLLRVAAGAGLVNSTDPDRLELSATGELLRSDAPDSMCAWAVMAGGPIFRSFVELMQSLETGRPAFERANGATHYDYLREHPEDARDFNEAMTAYSARSGTAIADTCDLSDARVLVDVGAGPGTVAAALLRANPGLHAILFDLPHIADQARRHMTAAGLEDRCEPVGGDFFDAVPAGGDVYLLASILHNWDDSAAVKILRGVRAAAAPGARLLIAEMTLAPGEQRPFALATDLVMLTAMGGRERTADEYERLLEQAGLEPVAVLATDSHLNVIDARTPAEVH